MSSCFGISRVIPCFKGFKARIAPACWRKRKQGLKNSSAARQFPLQLPNPWGKTPVLACSQAASLLRLLGPGAMCGTGCPALWYLHCSLYPAELSMSWGCPQSPSRWHPPRTPAPSFSRHVIYVVMVYTCLDSLLRAALCRLLPCKCILFIVSFQWKN